MISIIEDYLMNYIIFIYQTLLQAASPACTELETIVLNWVGKMINLPQGFLCESNDSIGGGVIQVKNKSFIIVSTHYSYIKF